MAKPAASSDPVHICRYQAVPRVLEICHPVVTIAADTMLARDVVNQVSHQYLIPTLQVGSRPVINKKTGEVRDVFAVVRTLGTERGCLSCADLIDPVRLSEKTLGDPTQIANQRYVDDPDVHAPSVITLNGIGAGWAANDLGVATSRRVARCPSCRAVAGLAGRAIASRRPSLLRGRRLGA